LIWLGILIRISQSAIFSGLNLEVFSLSRLRLEVEAGDGNAATKRALELRADPNRALTTILWGNVRSNVCSRFYRIRFSRASPHSGSRL
jgi:CBS domain containing-hemolysin-like protein